MNIIMKNSNKKSKKRYKIINNFTKKLPNFIIELLDKYSARIIITNLKNEFDYKFDYIGCYHLKFNNNIAQVDIYIDENAPMRNICYILAHEFGHFIDEIIGCNINNVEITKDNIKEYSISKTNKDIRHLITKESDFFAQVKYSESKTPEDILLEEYDIKEEFANCIADILLSIKYSRMCGTKSLICTELAAFNK